MTKVSPDSYGKKQVQRKEICAADFDRQVERKETGVTLVGGRLSRTILDRCQRTDAR
jgi:hypothetical protein